MTGTSFQRMFALEAAAVEPGFVAIPTAWLGPPREELGWAVPLSLVVARAERAVVAVPQVTAFSNGVVADVVALGRGLSKRDTPLRTSCVWVSSSPTGRARRISEPGTRRWTSRRCPKDLC